MSEFVSQFHFIRPDWFWALLPLIALLFWIFRQASTSNSWNRIIAPELLPFLTENPIQQQRQNYLWALAAGWLISVVALAGPTWQKQPQPVHRQSDAVVVLLDLSLSMLATDLKPSRLVIAQRKLKDLLKLRNEGLTGLVVFSGDAHSVSPLTDDSKTIAEIVPALSPEIMPVYGSNLADGLIEASRLLQKGGADKQSRIIVLTDGIHPNSFETTLELAKESLYPISILAVGTSAGAPIPKPDGGFLKDGSGAIVIPKLDTQALKAISAASGGDYGMLTIDDSDIQRLLSLNISAPLTDPLSPAYQKTRELERWVEHGPWLILPLLLLALPAFRKGWVFGLAIITSLPLATLPQPALAYEWQDLWKTPDQQGMAAMQNENPEQAAALFQNPEWKGSANYRNGKYEEAAEQFSANDSAPAHYNRGTALAKAGKLEEAMEAFDQALEIDPQLTDASINKQLVEERLKQQQDQQSSDSSDDGDQQDPDKQGEDQEQKDEGQSQQGGDQDQQNSQQSEGDKSQDQNNQQSGQEDQSQQQQDQSISEQDNQDEASSPESEQNNTEQSDAKASGAEEETPDSDKDTKQPEQDDGKLTKEQLQQQQKTEQMLRRLPDNPGILFQRKFQQQYLENQQSRNRQPSTSNQEPIW